MKKIFYFLLPIANILNAQTAQNLGLIGINTTQPLSLLDIRLPDNNSNINTGLLTASINNFPTTDPTNDQNGMLVNYIGSNLTNGLYYWDNSQNKWQYIFQNSTIKNNLAKISFVSTTGFDTIPAGSYTNWNKTNFDIINTPDASFKINSDGDIVVGQDGNYNIYFTGGVTQEAPSTLVSNCQITITKTSSLNIETELKTSSLAIPASDVTERSSNSIISMNATLQKNDIIKVKTKRVSTGLTTLSKPSTKFTIILSKLSN